MRGFSASLLAAAALLCACSPADQEKVTDRIASVAAPSAAAAVPPPPPAPAEFQARIEELARSFDGDVGIAVKDLQQGWAASWQGEKLLPQQSSMKIWLAVAVLDAVDQGRLRLDEPVVIRPNDLSVFNQPMVRPLVLDDGVHVATIDTLLRWALQKSDNAATDILMRRLGGGPAVQAVLDRKGLTGVRIGVEERLLQPRISGLEWRPEFIDGDLFNRARDQVGDAGREAALEAYLRNPADGATPIGTVNALEALKKGWLLSPASTQKLLEILSGGRGGGARLKAGVPTEWVVAHKTGTGPDWHRVNAGFNDVGLLIAPDGRAYAAAVYIGRTERGVGERQRLMAEVARVVAQHAGVPTPSPASVQVKAQPAAVASGD
ncbi:MAG: class A beta-lactamase-related serine hydrolase [Pseudomonadota bacterium]|nr:class A beta-lactamase-related serine hydrolase [Pseudomonadota bacterium]